MIRSLAHLLTATGLLTLAACGGPEPPHDGSPLRALDPPAAEGSGEPNLAVGADGAVHLSWLEPSPGGEGHRLRFSVLGGNGAPVPGTGWSAPRTVAEGTDFFVNWADFPSILPLPDGSLVAHWLQRNGEGTYAYGVRVAISEDGGATWSEPVVPHDDGTATEHGFVSLFPDPAGGVGMAWLDGRDFAAADGGRPRSPAEAEMSLRYARLAAAGAPSSGRSIRGRALVDGRVCDCCQTSVALPDGGPVLVYRDRSGEEVRDIYASRLGAEGWGEPRPVHRDGWNIAACPVNGPSADARGRRMAVAWFTAARDTSRVRVAFSEDDGRSFGAPIRVDDGRPTGRVDVVLAPDGSAVVSWIEAGEAGADLLLRRVTPSGEAGAPVTAAASAADRAAGFPRVALAGDRLVVAWTDPAGEGEVRAGWLPLEAVPGR